MLRAALRGECHVTGNLRVYLTANKEENVKKLVLPITRVSLEVHPCLGEHSMNSSLD